MEFRIFPLGETALLAEFATRLDLHANARIQRLAEALRQGKAPWIRDIVPALGSLAVHFDLDRVPPGVDPAAAAEEMLREAARQDLPEVAAASHAIDVPVCYDTELGPDLGEVSEALGLAPEEVARRHAASAHRVLMVGFSPGQPYIGGLDASLELPRRATPRTVVPAGSVAIANAQTAVYPFSISGGWNVIGRTPLKVFDVQRNPAAVFAPGMRVRFMPISRAEFDRRAIE